MRQLYVVIGDPNTTRHSGELWIDEQYWSTDRACIETVMYIYGNYSHAWDSEHAGVPIHFIPWRKK